MVVTLSFDVEEFDLPLERGRHIDPAVQIEVSTQGLGAVLALLREKGVVATFYVTANFARQRPDLIARIVAQGHELASHDFYHDPGCAPDPAGARKELERIGGVEVHGFRAPRLAALAPAALVKAGYSYDSSLNPTFLPGRYNNLRENRTVHSPGGLTIYPASVSWPGRVPLFWLSLHLLPTWLYIALARSAIRRDGHLNTYFHPWEFSGRLRDKAFGIPAYISRCSGPRLLGKLGRVIDALESDGCEFMTTYQYLTTAWKK